MRISSCLFTKPLFVIIIPQTILFVNSFFYIFCTKKIEKVNAPPSEYQSALSLTKEWGCIQSDKSELRQMIRVMHRRRSDENGSTNSSEAERRLCVTRLKSRQNVLFCFCVQCSSRRRDTYLFDLILYYVCQIIGVRLRCPKNSLSVTP